MRCIEWLLNLLLQRNMVTGVAALLCALAMAGTALAADAPSRRWAVLVGVNDYAEIQDLSFCSEDMEALKGQLVTSGFEKDRVVLLDDQAKDRKYLPFKANIERQLDLVLGLVGPDDLVVVAFSGHGVFIDGSSYLCPAEARLEDPQATMISVEKIYDRLAKCPASFKLLMVDACRNDPRAGRKSLQPAKSASAFAGSLERPPEGILLLASCAPGQISMEDKQFGHGVFMEYVLEGPRGKADAKGGNSDGKVSLLEVYRFASEATQLHVARTFNDFQTPTLKGEITHDVDIATIVAQGKINVPEDFRTISAAMEAAAPGSTITVQPGLYEESIPFKSGVRLVGVDRDKVIVRSPDSALVAAECDSGEILSMTFEGLPREDKHFVVFLYHSKLKISGCLVRSEDGQRPGIGCRKGDTSTIKGCTIDLCSFGIYASDAETAPTMIDNNCTRNTGSGIGFFEGAGGIARNNNCKNNKLNGISVTGEKTNPRLEENICVENQEAGIYVAEKAHSILVHNECRLNESDGIFVHGKETVARLEQNKVVSNRGSGVDVFKGAQCVLVKNECRDNTNNGVIVGESGVTLEENKCENNRARGIWIRAGSNANITSNSCESNVNSGIDVSDGSVATIKNNSCHSNGASGIAFYTASRGTVSGNFCSRNTFCGMGAWDANTDPTFTGNTCTFNKQNGIFFGKGSLGRESGNTATDNGFTNIYRPQ